jgi:ribose/xylose/arabinose/galactoside ABC-type transport system permease subunit
MISTKNHMETQAQSEWLAMTDILESASVMLIMANGMTICLIAGCLDLVGENGFLF